MANLLNKNKDIIKDRTSDLTQKKETKPINTFKPKESYNINEKKDEVQKEITTLRVSKLNAEKIRIILKMKKYETANDLINEMVENYTSSFSAEEKNFYDMYIDMLFK